MELICIRWLPGTGKSSMSEILQKELHAQYFSVDEYKRQSTCPEFKDRCLEAYAKTLFDIMNLQYDWFVIVEEVFWNKDFVLGLDRFAKWNGHSIHWFKSIRPIDELVLLEQERNRPIKNTREQLEKLSQNINSVVLDWEIELEWLSIQESVEKIKQQIFDTIK